MEMAKLLIARNEHLFITLLIMTLPFDNKLMSSYIESISTNPNYNSQMKFIQLPQDDSISHNGRGHMPRNRSNSSGSNPPSGANFRTHQKANNNRHVQATCYKLNGYPADWKGKKRTSTGSSTTANLAGMLTQHTSLDDSPIHRVHLPTGSSAPVSSIGSSQVLEGTKISNSLTFLSSYKPQVRNSVFEILNSGSTRLVGVVVDMMYTKMIDVANEFGLPSYVFYTSGAAMLGLQLHLQSLRDDFNQDVTDYMDDSEAKLSITTYVNPFSSKCLPFIAFDKDGGSTMYLVIFLEGFEKLKLFSSVPLLRKLGKFQIKEIAYALEKSGCRFLWSLKNPLAKDTFFSAAYENPEDVLPEGFLQRTELTGKVIGWAPKVAILSHDVRAFGSEYQWQLGQYNAEQQTNAFQLVKDLGIAVEINMDYRKDLRGTESNVIVKAEEIEKAIKQLMEPENEIRLKVKDMKEKSRLALKEGGSSYNSVGHFIEQVMDKLSKHH
ncbi:hypothetical protein H5410_037540 [Solanum commersonii]|uniref:Uncharacterized protein n=1 Tax=Solanum commersonii TaxID=4109 RepID=A0A9J5YAH7_SOLCO|nr:hypothetical protein H5410_037540 [Solanum commersonii]